MGARGGKEKKDADVRRVSEIAKARAYLSSKEMSQRK
jgi:hypothetical protein